MRKLYLILTLLVLPAGLFAQVKPDPDVIKVDTQLVDVPLAVSTSTGIPLKGLKASNFVIYEDGKKQDTVDFSATTAPFEVALLLDTSGSTRNDLQLIQRAAREFIASLRPGDRVAVIGFDTDRRGNESFAFSDVLSSLTSDRTQLNSAIDRLKTSNGTPYYDALMQTVEKVFRDKPQEEFRGRRALVALTDGVDSTSSTDFADAKDALARAGIVSFFIKVDTREFFEQGLLGNCQFAIRFSNAQIKRYYRSFGAKGNLEQATNFCELGDFERLAISKKLYEIADSEMDAIAKSSGGRVFPVADLGGAKTAFASVADEIGTKYTLGYYPTNDKKDGTYRKIRVDLIGLPKGTVLRSREGYTAPTH